MTYTTDKKVGVITMLTMEQKNYNHSRIIVNLKQSLALLINNLQDVHHKPRAFLGLYR